MQSGQSKARLSFGISEWGCVTAFSDQIRHGSRLSPFCRGEIKAGQIGVCRAGFEWNRGGGVWQSRFSSCTLIPPAGLRELI